MTVVAQPERGTASSHYDLLARLAAGGMAEIFLARANNLEGLERYVVLKRIRPEHGDDPRYLRMFLDEAKLAAQLQHPNIAQVFDLGRIGVDDYFYTMEYVHGKDVLELLGRCGDTNTRLPINVALAIISGAAAGLAHAHERLGPDGKPLGIVHRDVSPSNLMVSYEGTVKVLDFGVAKARHREQTQAGTIMGKLAYLAPEQCKTASELDHRADIFSLGIVLYEMLTNERAFRRDTDYDTLRAVMTEMPPVPSTFVDDLPHGLDEVVMRALAKDPDDRFATVTEMVDAIEEIAEVHGLSLTAGVLRRYMRDTWGTRPEPWRALDDIELIDDADVIEHSAIGLPIDAAADAVPPLQATGMIDISALFTKTSADLPPPHRVPLGSGQAPVVAPPFANGETGVLVGYAPPPPPIEPSVLIAPTPSRTAQTAKVPRRSIYTVVIAALVTAAVAGAGVAAYVMFVRTPAPVASKVEMAPAPTVTPIELPKQPAPTPAPEPVPAPIAVPVKKAAMPAPAPAKTHATQPAPRRPKHDSDALEKPDDEPSPAPKSIPPKPKKDAACTDPVECQF